MVGNVRLEMRGTGGMEARRGVWPLTFFVRCEMFMCVLFGGKEGRKEGRLAC